MTAKKRVVANPHHIFDSLDREEITSLRVKCGKEGVIAEVDPFLTVEEITEVIQSTHGGGHRYLIRPMKLRKELPGYHTHLTVDRKADDRPGEGGVLDRVITDRGAELRRREEKLEAQARELEQERRRLAEIARKETAQSGETLMGMMQLQMERDRARQEREDKKRETERAEAERRRQEEREERRIAAIEREERADALRRDEERRRELREERRREWDREQKATERAMAEERARIQAEAFQRQLEFSAQQNRDALEAQRRMMEIELQSMQSRFESRERELSERDKDRLPRDLARELFSRRIDEVYPKKSGLEKILENYMEPALAAFSRVGGGGGAPPPPPEGQVFSAPALPPSGSPVPAPSWGSSGSATIGAPPSSESHPGFGPPPGFPEAALVSPPNEQVLPSGFTGEQSGGHSGFGPPTEQTEIEDEPTLESFGLSEADLMSDEAWAADVGDFGNETLQ